MIGAVLFLGSVYPTPRRLAYSYNKAGPGNTFTYLAADAAKSLRHIQAGHLGASSANAIVG